MNKQFGVGLVEVLVSLIILSIAVLGFTALQIRALAAGNEAGQNIQAMNIARDLTERMRMNRNGLNDYASTSASGTAKNCDTQLCTASEMAKFDFLSVQQRAERLGMTVNILSCQGSTLPRRCIYVAWDETTATNGTEPTDCTNGAAYVTNAQCIIMEVYNND